MISLYLLSFFSHILFLFFLEVATLHFLSCHLGFCQENGVESIAIKLVVVI